MRVVNQVPSIHPRVQCTHTRRTKNGWRIQCQLIAGHAPAGVLGDHWFCPLQAYEHPILGRTFEIPDLPFYRGPSLETRVRR